MVTASEAVGKRLKALCEERNISYSELAEKSGVPKRKIVRMAMGAPSNPGLVLMIRICDVLEVSLDEFIDTEEFRVLKTQTNWF